MEPFPIQPADIGELCSDAMGVHGGLALKCKCGSPMQLLEKYVRNHKKEGEKKRHLFYSCLRWPACRGSIQAHPDGSPVGVVTVDPELKAARYAVHKWLEKLTGMPKSKRYALLSRLLKLKGEKCHAGMFDLETAKRAVLALEKWYNEHYKPTG